MHKPILSTELFEGKIVPSFVKEHKLFNSPIVMKKVFPSIGLTNFKDSVKIQKSLVDVRKENGYVLNLLTVMHSNIHAAIESMKISIGKLQWIGTKEAREAGRTRIDNLAYWQTIAENVLPNFDPHNKDLIQFGIELNNGLVEIKLLNTIVNGTGKKIFGKGANLFSTYNRLRNYLLEIDVPLQDIEQTEAFKIFSKENIPNKPYEIIFTSTGKEGAWDILTMSMRGIKSCQRWDGEYPRCLTGSIMSRFVGLIYITSGAPAESHPTFGSLGTKMMRRCVVRYAINADEGKPCIIIDKMYTEFDKDILAMFVNSLKSRTKLEVLYAPDLAKSNRLRHIYIPHEEIKEEILHREASYQDTVLRSKDDLNIAFLNIQKEEVERDTKVLLANLELHIANCLSEVYDGTMSADDEIVKVIRNIRMTTSFSALSSALTKAIISNFRAPRSNGIYDNKTYYKKYLREFIIKRKSTYGSSCDALCANASQYSSRTSDFTQLAQFVFSIVVKFFKQEIRKGIN